MARRSPIRVGIALALVFVISPALQAEETCRTGCRGGSQAQTFKYQEGTTYKYNFDSKIEMTLSSAEGQKTTTEIKAQVLLTAHPQCAQILKLTNVQILTNDGKKHGQIPDVDKPIRLTLTDGHLDDSLCTTPGDTQNALNIKRAIASLFQAPLKSGPETDVFGVCPTEVSHHKDGATIHITKTRNLNACAYRENVRQDFLASAFNLHSEIKASPLLNADFTAQLKVKNGILENVHATETYLYVPFSVGTSGAKTTIETTLKLTGTTKDNAQPKVSHPRSIIFEDPHPVNSPKSNVNSILAAVKDVTKTIGVTVGEKTAKEFINLIKILRVSKKDDLLAVYNQVKAGVGFPDKAGAKKIFLKALVGAGNGDNVEVAIELLKNKELDALEQKLVYLGLSLVRHTTEASLNAAANLLNQANLPREAYLGIGNLAGRHCRLHQCKNIEAVSKVTQKLIAKLGDGKAANRNDENDIVYVLKALSNIHHLNDGIVAKITAIANDRNAPNRLRVAALETYLSDPCKDKLRDSAAAILKDIQQDSEVRIKAYLALVQCPTPKVAIVIKTLLEAEPSYQVGGFIVSHIRNIRASANPDKELAKQHLGAISLPNRYPVDLRKYSSNGEFSSAINTLGVANAIESNLIYSQNSFLPRSASLNLTAEVFGHSFNFLELEARQENLDRLIEHYVGPKGILRTNSLQDLWNANGAEAGKVIRHFRERLSASLRSRRDVTKAELEQIAKQVQIKTNELNHDLDVDFSVKAFGSEILFVNVNDDVGKWTPDAIIDRVIKEFNKGLDNIKKFEETFRSNFLFLDAELAYPTSAGFPLRLGLEGAANLQVKASGAVDVRALLRHPTTVKVSLIPSANVEVSGRWTLDALVVESGLKIVSTLHTATGGDLIVDLFNNGVDVKFALPVEKQNLVSASHDVVFHTREWAAAEVNTPLKFAQNKDFSICFDQLSPIVGLTFCGDITGPNLSGKQVPVLPFPLAGDAKVAVTIERDDVSQYHFRAVAHTNEKIGTEITLQTLDKQGKKKVSLDIEAFARPERFLKATLTSPVFSGNLEGRITSNDHEKSAFLKLALDTKEYFGKIGVGIEGSPSKATYKPIFQYKTPDNSALQQSPYRVEGQIIAEHVGPKTTYTFENVKVIIPNQKPISLNGNVGDEPEVIFADLITTDGTNTASLKGRVQINPKLVKYNVEVKNSLNPQANIHVQGELARNNEDVKHSFQAIHGSDLSSKTNILSLDNAFKYRNKGPQDFHLETKNKLSYPALGANVQADFTLKPQAVNYDLDVQYNEVKLGSELDWEHTKKPDGIEFQLDFGLWGLNNRVDLKSKRHLTSADQSQITNSLEVNGKKLEVNGKIKHHVKPHDIDIHADLTVKTPNHNTPFKVINGLKLNANDVDASLKLSNGNTVYADIFLKANRAGNANGAIKVTLKDVLVVNGQLKANKGTGNGDLVVELPASKRSAKIDTTFTIHDPNYNVVVNIYPAFNDDKTKKIVLSTHSKVTISSIDSKNFIEILGNKIEGNVRGNYQGDLRNGKINGDVEVILPNSQYLAAKINRDLKSVNGIVNGNFLGSLEYRKNKNSPGAKITLKGEAKNTKPEERILDLNYHLIAEDGNGKDLKTDVTIKRQPHGESMVLEITNKISGSVISSPIETNVKATHRRRVGAYEITSGCHDHGTISLKGNYDLTGETHPITGDITFNLASQSKVIKSIKVAASGSVLKGATLELQGQTTINAETPESVLVDFHTSGELHAGDQTARAKGTLKSGKHSVTVNGGYKHKDQNCQADALIEYDGKTVKSDVSVTRISPHEYKVDASLATPIDNFKTNRLQVHGKRSEDNSHHTSEVTLTNDGKTWSVNTELRLSEATPMIDIRAKCPEGKLAQLRFKVTRASDRQLAADLKVVNQRRDFALDASVDANIETIDDFHIKVTANSPNLKIDHYVIEALNKPAKGGKKIQVSAKSGTKNLLSGSTSYTSRDEHGKLIVEGSGSFKVRDDTKSANFKFIKQNLNQAKNGETGLEISFDASLGSKAIDAELKVTNKQFRILNSYCEEKKQCAHIEVDAKTTADDLTHYNQELEVAIDLRKLGLSHEFGLKAVTTRKEWILDHTVDIHFQSQENNKYQYSLYFHPKEAGVSLTTPKRVVALEAKLHLPKTLLKDGGKITSELVLFMDKKNQPNQKSSLEAWLNIDPRGTTLEGEAKFTNPALTRPLSVSLKSRFEQGSRKSVQHVVVLDVFAQQNQKLIVTVQQLLPDFKNPKVYEVSQTVDVKSAGLNVDIHAEESYFISRESYEVRKKYNLKYHVGSSKYDNAVNVELSPKQYQLLVRVLNLDLAKVVATLQLGKASHVVDAEVASYGVTPAIAHLEVKNWNTVKFNVARKNAPNDKLTVNSGLIPGQIADFRAEITKGGSTHELLHASLKLDDANFLKSDYGINSKNIKELLLDRIKADVTNHAHELKRVAEQWSNDAKTETHQISELIKKATPNLTPLRSHYTSELSKIKDEILADKTIKEISELLHNALSALSHTVGETFNHASELLESLVKTINNSFRKVLEVIEKELLPKFKDTASKVIHVASEILDRATDVILTYVAKVSEIAEKFQPELKQLGAVIGEFSQDVGRVLLRAYQNIRVILADQWRVIYAEIEALPIVEQIRDALKGLQDGGVPSSERFSAALKDIIATIKDLAPTEELRALVGTVGDYIQKKIARQEVDDGAAIDKIIKAALAVIRRFTALIPLNEADGFDKLRLPLPVNLLHKLPRLAAVKFSPLAYLLKEDLPDAGPFLLSLIDTPRNLIPPFQLFTVIAQGQHIFTFDGKHMTFPGKCNYLLAHDALDGNFTLVGSYDNGKLSAITLTAGGDSVTAQKGGKVLLNQQPHELPVRRLDVAAFRGYPTIALVSRAGIEVMCALDLEICSIRVSGFYHGRVRGLLGNGNNEPFDDFALGNGKIVESESDFGNAFRSPASCGAVTTVDHHHGHGSPVCDKLFGWESASLRLCYPFVDRANFKMACAHGLAAGVKGTERHIALAYVAACVERNVPVRLPSEFLTCTNGEKVTELGETFTVKTPGKAADIVLLVDTIKKNEQVYKDYIQPLVQELTQELSSKGISDIEFHLITYGGDNQWPSHVTSAGGKAVFKGKAPSVAFSDAPKEETLITGDRFTDQVIALIRSLGYDVKLAFGQHLQALAYNEGIDYPFRAHASKSIIAVTGNSCEVGRFYPLQVLRTLLYRDKSINLNLITPFDKLNVKDAKHTKEVVGFSQTQVFTAGKAKAKAGSELYKDIEYSDYCVDFTLQNGGNVFVLDNFVHSKGAARQQFVKVTAHSILEQIVDREDTLDCECRAINAYSAKNVCSVVQSKDKVQKKSGGKS